MRPNLQVMQEWEIYMLDAFEVAKDVIEQFQKVQKHMFIAKEENATRTYESLKEDYLLLKAILHVAGADLAEIDKIKE